MAKSKSQALKVSADTKTAEVAKSITLSAREAASLKRHEKRVMAASPLPIMKHELVENGDGTHALVIRIEHSDMTTGFDLIESAIGSTNFAYSDGVIKQLGAISPLVKGNHNVHDLNYLLAMMAGIAPRDQLESMLAAQMAAVHHATLNAAQRLAYAGNMETKDSAERAFNKLARTFTTQMEALKRYRSKGEQRVYVERVTVQEGGQAVVGNVTHGGGAADEFVG